MNKASLLFVFFICFYACDLKDEQVLPSSSGKYGEVLVVIDTVFENNNSGKALEQIFYKEIDALPQREAMFRMSTVEPKNFKSILERSRNILRLSIKEGNKAKIIVTEDVWAKNQLVIDVKASSDADAAKLLEKNTTAIQAYFNDQEIKRLQNQFSKKPQKKVMNIIKKRFSLEVLIPPAYVMMDSSGNGLWLKKEQQVGQHSLLQGIIFYECEYDSDTVFSISQMISSRNDFCKTHIQGAMENSYMAVYKEFKPIVSEINLNGIYAKSYRGLWSMKNDFMGGPYIHYAFVDEERQKVMHVDAFVYAPKFNKREYLRELKAILETVKL